LGWALFDCHSPLFSRASKCSGKPISGEKKKHTQIITTDYPISDIYDVAFETNSKVKKINIIIMTKYGKKNHFISSKVILFRCRI